MKLLLAFLASLLAITPALAQSQSPPIQATASAAISTSSSGLAKVVTGIIGQRIYVTTWNITSSGTTTFQWEYGTGTNCGTGTTALTGAYALVSTTNPGLAVGSIGSQLIVPLTTPTGTPNDLCINLGSAVAVAGSFAYAQF